MKNSGRMVGICLTKLEDEHSRTFLQAMNQAALAQGDTLLVFNSFLDFFYHNEYEQGAKAVYQLINFELLDALVILDETFFDKELVAQLIARAHAHSIPVVVLYGEYPGCFSIRKDYDEVFGQLVAHVLDVHRPCTVRYIAGTQGMPHTERRLAVFRQVMASRGRTVDERDIAYCDDWSGPVVRTIDAWAACKAIPDALICASDIMAAAACEQLEQHGLRIPGDVIVTGFDGLPSLTLLTPQLTTCAQDIAGSAALVFRMIDEALTESRAPYTASEAYKLILSESCGCGHTSDDSFRVRSYALFRQLDDTLQHEQQIFARADSMLRSTDSAHFIKEMRRNLLPDSLLALNADLLCLSGDDAPDPAHPFSAEMLAVEPYREEEPLRFPLKAMLPTFPASAKPGMYVFQAVYAGPTVCGYYAVRPVNIQVEAHKIRRLTRVMNLEFNSLLSRIRQQQAVSHISRMQLLDPTTGLMNLRGVDEHITQHYAQLSEHCIAVSIYVIHRYQDTLENKGLQAIDSQVLRTSDALREVNASDALIARIAPSEFLVITFRDTPEQISAEINDTAARFFALLEKQNAQDPDTALEINCGCVVSRPGWKNSLSSFIKAANGELYLNRMKAKLPDTPTDLNTVVDAQAEFQLLLDQNLFRYHFQPIVDAHTGEICAYEALMRTVDPVHMMPNQILAIADQQQRLYDIEHATLFNVMEYVDSHPELFAGKRIFINTIPGFFLNDADRELLTRRYSHLFSSCTIEITETRDTDDAELVQIRRLEHNGDSCQLAIDDYGTGFSNIVNLLRYQPQVIKIDRFLISGVNTDYNKQLFIRSTLEFARLNNIKVLAEGVETAAELSKVLELGVDLVQGYYLSRPSEVVKREIPESVRDFIIEETLRFSRFGAQQKVYHALSGDHLDLLQLAVEKYTAIELSDGNVTVIGQPHHFIEIPIVTTPGSYTQLNLENVYIRTSIPAITLGAGSSMVMTVHGDNAIDQEGIRVPAGASFTLKGDGCLAITSLQRKGAVLGGSPDETFGHIRVDMTGRLSIHAESETSICIGGGMRDSADPIELISGDLRLEAKGIHTAGVGCLVGTCNAVVGPAAHVRLVIVGNEAVGIGTLEGMADITCDGCLDVRADGERILGVGVLRQGIGHVRLHNQESHFVLHGATSVCVGSHEGQVDVDCCCDLLHLYIEGARICGLGCFNGGVTTITGGNVIGQIFSVNPLYLGSSTVITGGSIIFSGDNADCTVQAVNQFGVPLVPLVITNRLALDVQITDGVNSYRYTAAKHKGADHICAYVPADFAAAFTEA